MICRFSIMSMVRPASLSICSDSRLMASCSCRSDFLQPRTTPQTGCALPSPLFDIAQGLVKGIGISRFVALETGEEMLLPVGPAGWEPGFADPVVIFLGFSRDEKNVGAAAVLQRVVAWFLFFHFWE